MEEVEIKLKHWWRSWIVRLAGFMTFLEGLNVILIEVDTTGIDPVIMGTLRLVILVAIIYNRIFGVRQAITLTAAMKPVATDKVIPAEQVAEMKAK